MSQLSKEPNASRFLIRPTPPFDFPRSAGIHGRWTKSLPDVFENGCYKRVLHVGRKAVLVSISSKGTIERPKLSIKIHPPLGRSQRKLLREQLRSMFATTFDFKRFWKGAEKDQLMRTVAESLRGLRPIPPPTIFEAIVIAITEQQISLDAAIAIRSRLVEKYGEKVRCEGKTFYSFPTPKSLAKAKFGEIKAVGLSAAKTRYVLELSKKVVTGEITLEKLPQMDDDKAIIELTKVRGIGRWSAEYVLVRGLGRMNSLPADDLGIQRAVSQAYFKGRKITSKDVRKVLGKFAPYSGIAAFYLMYYLFWEPKRPWNLDRSVHSSSRQDVP